MLRLTKYEIRKNITGIIILLAVLAALEVYFLVGVAINSQNHTAMAIGLLVLAATVSFFFVFIFGVASYSKELSSKTSYMTFMTPISSFSIIGSKLISTFLIGIFLAAVIISFALIDMALLNNVFPEIDALGQFIDGLFNHIGYSTGEVLLSALVLVLEMLIEFFGIISFAYLAITLSSTAFQNKKFKGIVSVIAFVIIVWAVDKVGDLIIPTVYSNGITSIYQAIVSIIPFMVYFAVAMVISLVASAKLLDKKVSL